jgi:DNA-binding NtrC family response regulator
MSALVLSQVDQSAPIRIMVLDDEPAIGRAVQRNLTSDRFKVELEYEVAPVLARLQAGHGDWDVFILDINLRGDIDGFEVLHHLKRASARTSVVMISGNDSANTAAACLRAGAFDYLTKPIRHTELSAAVSKAAIHAWAQRANKPEPELGDDAATSALIGSSAVIHQLRSRIRQVSGLPTSILIQGETGTGKELVARAIHARSERKHHRFVPLNCAAIPEGLIDSALFGHKSGAFTSAFKDHPGAFVEADNGTLFLDEIGDMALTAQVKLLRAVQEFEVRPVGATNVRRVDVRLISATHVDLQAAAREDKFRADLLYRLDVFRLTVPPLRERLEDIPELVAHFIHKHGARAAKHTGKLARPLPAIHQSTLEALMLCDWPGNVRQLENAIQSALALCGDNELVLPSHLPDWVTPRSMIASPGSWRTPSDDASRARAARGTDQPGEAAATSPPASASEQDPDPTAAELAFGSEADLTAFEVLLRNEFGKLVDLEGDKLPHISEFSHKIMWLLRRNYLHLLMSRVAGNLTQAARVAGVDRANLRRLLRAHGLNASSYRAKPDDKN